MGASSRRSPSDSRRRLQTRSDFSPRRIPARLREFVGRVWERVFTPTIGTSWEKVLSSPAGFNPYTQIVYRFSQRPCGRRPILSREDAYESKRGARENHRTFLS